MLNNLHSESHVPPFPRARVDTGRPRLALRSGCRGFVGLVPQPLCMKSKVCSEEQTGKAMLHIRGEGVNKVKPEASAPIRAIGLNFPHFGNVILMKTTVLLVEDSKFLKITAERLLVKSGYIVVTAEDGEEALRMVRASPPDIILLDMLLPKLGGLEVLAEIKKNPATHDIPVIILSSLSQHNEEKLVKAGAAAYFEKSKMIDDANSGRLHAAIEKAVSEAKMPRQRAVGTVR